MHIVRDASVVIWCSLWSVVISILKVHVVWSTSSTHYKGSIVKLYSEDQRKCDQVVCQYGPLRMIYFQQNYGHAHLSLDFQWHHMFVICFHWCRNMVTMVSEAPLYSLVILQIFTSYKWVSFPRRMQRDVTKSFRVYSIITNWFISWNHGEKYQNLDTTLALLFLTP